MTVTELGNELSVDHSTISRWENGVIVPSIDQLYKIAVYFKVSSDFLIGLQDY